MRCFDSVTNTKKDPLLAGAKLADLHLEGEGVGELVALAGQALTGLHAQWMGPFDDATVCSGRLP